MRIELPSGTAAELALPVGAPTRGVALAPDVMGLRPLFDEMAARLATEHGWAVCAPEPFPDHADAVLEERIALTPTRIDARQVGDLVAAADELRLRTGVERVAVLGFCMGGMYALKCAPTGAFDRVVSFYGMIRRPENFRGPGQAEPIDLVRQASELPPILAIVGGRDAYTPEQDVADLEATGATIAHYPEGEHGFVHDASRPTHRADDAADAWRRAVGFLS